MGKLTIPKNIFEKLFKNSFREGGEQENRQPMTQDDVYKELTGQVKFGLPPNSPAPSNAEIETNEYVKDSQGVQKAIGDTHENGGMPVNLEDGSQILSDHLKVGEDLAKKLSKDFDIKVKASDTYSKVLDKYNQKIGLTKATKESEEMIKKLDEQQKNTKSEATLGLNKEYLTGEINELGQKIEPLNQQKEQMFDLLFAEQEKSKPKEEQANNFQMGGTVGTSVNGDLITKYNLTPERVKELIPNYQDGAIHINPQGTTNPFLNPQYAINKENVPEGMSPAQYYEQQARQQAVYSTKGAAPKYTPEQKETIRKHYNKVILDPKSKEALNKAIDENRLVFNQGMLEAIQQGKTVPVQLQHKGKETGTYGEQEEARINGYLYGNAFEKLTGKKFDASNLEHTKQLYGNVIPALKEQGVIYDASPRTHKGTTLFGNVYASMPGFKVTQPAKKAGQIDLDALRGSSAGQKQMVAEEYGTTVEALDEAMKNPTNKFLTLTPEAPAPAPPAPEKAVEAIAPKVEEVIEEEEKKKQGMGFLALPDQSPLTPPSMMMPLKFQPRVYAPSYKHISPEAVMTELGRSQMATRQQISQMPDAIQAATLSSLDANNAAALNKVLSDTARYNAQADERTDAAAAEAMTKQSFADAQSAAMYQSLVGRELNAYDANLQRYYNRLNEENVDKWKQVEMTNQFNALHRNVQRTPEGYLVSDYQISPVTPADVTTPTTTTEKKKTTAKGKNGGRFNKNKKRFGS